MMRAKRSIVLAATAAFALILIFIKWGDLLTLFPSLTYNKFDNRTFIYNRGNVLAVYNHTGNTFTEFWYKGVNLIGGFSSGTPNSNSGGPIKGHSSDYPFGWIANGGKPQWLGFWAGFNYIDTRSSQWKLAWTGINGNPLAEQAFQVSQPTQNILLLNVMTQVTVIDFSTPSLLPLFKCEVVYLVSVDGIGVKNVVTFLNDLQPLGWDDTGGQLMMSQVDCDLDPSKKNVEVQQPDLYYKLALTDDVININPFPPYQFLGTPSNVYSEQHIPNTALVPMNRDTVFISPFERPSRNVNLALRIDLKRSTLPPLEYYCEYNGERDYLNYLFSSAVGLNRSMKTIPKGTQWILYGDLIPWQGNDPKTIYNHTLLCASLP